MAKITFEVGSWVVYPAHGVGKLESIEKVELNGETFEFFVISFEKNKLVLKIPTTKAISAGLRKLSTQSDMVEVFESLKHKSKKKKAMWSKRAQEYEGKINSGDPVSLAQVIRELYKGTGETTLSFGERQVYQLAMERLAKEISIIENIEETEAVQKLEGALQAA
ncbi:MAG: CarD family transcriptional regulator [Alphaproteobacteria bacterium]|nr:CarD family transcriptional regulator [Alphaproteobacteria bacterium]